MAFNQELFTNKTNDIIAQAQRSAIENSNNQIDPLHLALSIFNNGELGESIVERFNISNRKVRLLFNELVNRLPKQSPPPDDIIPSRKLLKLLEK